MSGSASFPLGGGGTGGTASTTGGTAGTGGTAQITGGTGAGGSGGMGGVGELGGSGAGGASASAGGGMSAGSAGSGGNGNAGGRMNGSGGNAAGGRSMAGAGGMNGGGGGMAGGGGTSSTANCSLSVKVTTASAGGRYSPRNIGAIWVADQSGNFIRSLEVWAQRRVNYLTLWNSATSKAGTPGNRVDIVSQATLSSHKEHTATWACQDFNGKPVPDGTYRVYFEMTDNSGTGPNRFEQFTKGGAPMTVTPADNNNFKAIELSYEP
jgi:hypothetical protein